MKSLAKSLTKVYEVDKSYKSLIKTSNAMEYIESDIQNIEPPRTDDPVI